MPCLKNSSQHKNIGAQHAAPHLGNPSNLLAASFFSSSLHHCIIVSLLRPGFSAQLSVLCASALSFLFRLSTVDCQLFLFHHKIHKFVRHHDPLHHFFIRDMPRYRRISQRLRHNSRLAHSRLHNQLPAHAPIHLHHDLTSSS